MSDAVIPQVELDFMNTDHAAATSQINALDMLLSLVAEGDQESLDTVEATLQSVYQHSVEHFSREEAEMVRVGFPAYGCHKGEHERVLEELRAILQEWQQNKDINLLQNYVRNTLPGWLQAHVETMDTVTAMFVASRG
ncbi:bacteriohemerythrin [Amphritea sp. HPY]|uniref:bacteriohemerythrin n=1 Tax=Amphritea sp. HPY TaxID=3421652 RepID=UPI003D7CE1A6